eukprot:scaffold53024_cov30-Tisochrysis_lutea.AAC.2
MKPSPQHLSHAQEASMRPVKVNSLTLLVSDRVGRDAVDHHNAIAHRVICVSAKDAEELRGLRRRERLECRLDCVRLDGREARDADGELEQARKVGVAYRQRGARAVATMRRVVLGRRRRRLDRRDEVARHILDEGSDGRLEGVIVGLCRQREEALQECGERHDRHSLRGDGHVKLAARTVVGAVDVAHDI